MCLPSEREAYWANDWFVWKGPRCVQLLDEWLAVPGTLDRVLALPQVLETAVAFVVDDLFLRRLCVAVKDASTVVVWVSGTSATNRVVNEVSMSEFVEDCVFMILPRVIAACQARAPVCHRYTVRAPTGDRVTLTCGLALEVGAVLTVVADDDDDTEKEENATAGEVVAEAMREVTLRFVDAPPITMTAMEMMMFDPAAEERTGKSHEVLRNRRDVRSLYSVGVAMYKNVRATMLRFYEEDAPHRLRNAHRFQQLMRKPLYCPPYNPYRGPTRKM